MPIKLPDKIVKGEARERIDAFRKTLPLDEAWSAEEVAAHPDVKCHSSTISMLIRKNKWGIIMPGIRNQPAWHLVHPKTLAKYASKS